MTKLFQVFKTKKINFYFFSIDASSLSLALISGLLVGTSYIPFPAWALGFCYIPLWISAQNQTESGLQGLKKIFALGWITQFVLTLIGFNWIAFVAQEFGQIPPVISWLIVILFAATMHIYIPISLCIARHIQDRYKTQQYLFPVLAASSLALIERVWPSIFEWNLGYTLLWMKWPLAQWADVVGFWGLSSWILLFQAGLLVSYNIFKQKNKIYLPIAIFSFLMFITTTLWMTGDLKSISWQARTQSEFPQALITITQGNIANDDKIQAEKGGDYQPYVVQHFIALTQAELSTTKITPDFIVWPETALPISFDQYFENRINQQMVMSQLRTWKSTLITGAYSQDLRRRDHLGQNIIRNSIFFKGPLGEVAPPYNKSQLLVFGEYLPFGEQFPFLYKIFPFVGTYEKGPGPTVNQLTTLQNKNIQIGAQICYESLDPAFSRDLAKKGAQLIINVTNDSWFGWWAEPYQHMIMTLARGLENRLPLARSTNTGISTVIDSSGMIHEQSPIGQSWTHTYSVPYPEKHELTFYNRWGHFDFVIYILLILIMLI